MAQDFARTFGSPPLSVAWAPGRVNLIGDHTDYCEGFAMPIAIDRYTVCLSRPSKEPGLRVRSAAQNTLVEISASIAHTPKHDWTDYLLGVLEGFRERGAVIDGLDVLVAGDLPQGAGLSSSAALETAFALTLEHATGLALPAGDRITLCQQAENEFAGMPCGVLDQFAVNMGRAGSAMLLDCRARTADYVTLPRDPAFAVLDSGVRHALVDGGYAKRLAQVRRAEQHLGISLRDACLDDLGALDDPLLERRARHVITENQRVHAFAAALTAHDGPLAGQLMLDSQRSLAGDYEVSCPEVDDLVTACLNAGALGARMTGGGFGGSVIALVPAERREAFDAALSAGADADMPSVSAPLWLHPVDGAAACPWKL